MPVAKNFLLHCSKSAVFT